MITEFPTGLTKNLYNLPAIIFYIKYFGPKIFIPKIIVLSTNISNDYISLLNVIFIYLSVLFGKKLLNNFIQN